MNVSGGPSGHSLRDALLAARARIEASAANAAPGSCETPYLDAVILLSDATGYPKERLLASLSEPLAASHAARFESLVRARCSGRPISYLLGRKEFYGRTFAVGEATLVPRPETELLVELALSLLDRIDGASGTPHLHDCCTGSGCIAITIKAERPDTVVSASDISASALEVALANARSLLADVAIRFEQGGDLEALAALGREGLEPPIIVTANPPYLTDNEYAALAACNWPEPRVALEAGADGLSVIRTLASQAARHVAPAGWLITEIGATQAGRVSEIFYEAGFAEISIHKDLSGSDRACMARLASAP
jgi:release factor glutamine methyltransferase